jgi:hypothetical protein
MFYLGFAVYEEMVLITSWHQGLIPQFISWFLNVCLAMSIKHLSGDSSWRTHQALQYRLISTFPGTSGRRLVESAQSDRGLTELTSDRSERQFAASIHSTECSFELCRIIIRQIANPSVCITSDQNPNNKQAQKGWTENAKRRKNLRSS